MDPYDSFYRVPTCLDPFILKTSDKKTALIGSSLSLYKCYTMSPLTIPEKLPNYESVGTVNVIVVPTPSSLVTCNPLPYSRFKRCCVLTIPIPFFWSDG